MVVVNILISFFMVVPVFGQELFFNRLTKKCIEEDSKETLKIDTSHFLKPCFTGKFQKVNFQELQKDPRLQTLYLQGSKSEHSFIYQQHISNIYLEYASLKQNRFLHSKFENAFFTKSDLRGMTMEGSEFTNFSFKEADLRAAKIMNSRFVGGDFIGADLKGSIISDSSFEDCFYGPNFKREAILINVKFKNCHEQAP